MLRENVISGSAPAGEYPVTLRAHSRLGSDEKTVTLRVAPDGALRTPLLGFTSWNAFASGVTQADIESTAELLVRTGLAEYGYTYVNLDSGWQGAYGGAYDAVQPNAKFPNMRAMYDALHRQEIETARAEAHLKAILDEQESTPARSGRAGAARRSRKSRPA